MPPPTTHSRSQSRERRIPSRPTTPLRPPSRTSLRGSQSTTPSRPIAGSSTTEPNSSSENHPINALEPAFAELSDSMADLEANMMHLQLLHESLARFNENFGSLLYGLNMSAFCVDFPEAPIPQSFTRARQNAQTQHPAPQSFTSAGAGGGDIDATFLTNDTSFVENPPTSSIKSSKSPGYGPSSSGRGTFGGRFSRSTTGVGGVGRGGVKRGGGGGTGGGVSNVSGIARGVSSRGSSVGMRGGRGTRGSVGGVGARGRSVGREEGLR